MKFFSEAEMSCHRKKFLVTGRNTQITAILDVFCRVWLPLFRAKFLAESIGSHEVKYFIPPWAQLKLELNFTLIFCWFDSSGFNLV